MLRHVSMFLGLGILSLASAGCCCVQGMPGGACGSSCGPCGAGPLLGFAGCRGACEGVYVDEWISEPPTVDNCGNDCGGCRRCRQTPGNLFRMLWGTPYATSCDTGLCGPSCGDGCGCDSMADGDYYADESYGPPISNGYVNRGSSCNCGGSHAGMHSGGSVVPLPSSDSVMPLDSGAPSVAPQIPPAPAPSLAPASATRRLNPAVARRR